MLCEIAIYRMVEKFQATDSWLDKIKYHMILFDGEWFTLSMDVNSQN
jgi:hypothetical protein